LRLGGLLAKDDALSRVPDDDDEERFEQYELAMRLVRAVDQADLKRVLQAARDVDGDLHLQRSDDDPILP
jgi:hypothetical protein